MSTRTRLCLDVEPEFRLLLDDLMGRVGARSLTEVIRRSARLYDTMSAHERAGGAILLENGRKVVRVTLL